MRKLTDGTNIDAATGDYPNGRTRDKVGVTPGTILNEVLTGDIQQFFQKLLIDSGLTENDLPDNITNGYQLIEALIAKIDFLNGGLRTKLIPLGDWDMDATEFLILGAVTDVTEINYRGAKVTIIRDDSSQINDLEATTSAGNGGSASFSSSQGFVLSRSPAGIFDTTNYDSTSFNRGFAIIYYDPTV